MTAKEVHVASSRMAQELRDIFGEFTSANVALARLEKLHLCIDLLGNPKLLNSLCPPSGWRMVPGEIHDEKGAWVLFWCSLLKKEWEIQLACYDKTSQLIHRKGHTPGMVPKDILRVELRLQTRKRINSRLGDLRYPFWLLEPVESFVETHAKRYGLDPHKPNSRAQAARTEWLWFNCPHIYGKIQPDFPKHLCLLDLLHQEQLKSILRRKLKGWLPGEDENPAIFIEWCQAAEGDKSLEKYMALLVKHRSRFAIPSEDVCKGWLSRQEVKLKKKTGKTPPNPASPLFALLSNALS